MIEIDGLYGFPVITSDLMIETVLYPRSPSRARRRAKMGHRQHTVMRPMRTAMRLPNGTLVLHPEIFAMLQRLTK